MWEQARCWSIPQVTNKSPDTTVPLGPSIQSSDLNIRCQNVKKGAKVTAQDGTGQFNYCSHCLMKNKPSRWDSVGTAVLTAASCLHDLIYKDTPLLIASRMPTVENCFKCTFAVRYLAAVE